MKRSILGLLVAGLIFPLAAPALGDVGGFLGDLVGGKSAAGDFAGTWTGPAGSDIDHIVVTATGTGPVRIQVFGRCEARVCNWGALPARVRTDAPNSETVRALSADFNLGFALRHVTLHRLPGNTLRYDMVTEFTDGSDRRDYETAGQLVPAGTPVAAAPPVAVAGATPAPVATPAPSATPLPATPPAPVAAPPPPASAGSGIAALNPLSWFSSKPAAPAAAPVASSGAVPIDNSIPVGVSTAAPVDDCFAVDTGHVFVGNANGNWTVRDFLHVVQSFGPYRAAAEKGLKTIGFYRFDEICRIGRGTTNMAFLRAAGEVPHQPMPGEDCLDVHPDKVVAVQRDGDWKVVDGTREIFDYGSDQDGAAQAASVIRSLALSRQCYFDRANIATSYWLSR